MTTMNKGSYRLRATQPIPFLITTNLREGVTRMHFEIGRFH
jgi:hypothetical protein